MIYLPGNSFAAMPVSDRRATLLPARPAWSRPYSRTRRTGNQGLNSAAFQDISCSEFYSPGRAAPGWERRQYSDL